MHTENPTLTRFLADESETLAFGAALGPALEGGTVVYLNGELGAGKTTLVRGVLRGLGFTGRVKSPTFTLVEVYEISSLYFYHFDFYRFDDPQELAQTGFREYFRENAVCFVEWPDKAAGLPPPDVDVYLRVAGTGRTLGIEARTEVGTRCLTRLHNAGGP